MTRALNYILLLTIIGLTWSCQDVLWPWEEIPDGSGSITLTLSSQDDITLETKSNLTEGLEFSDLMVLLANNSGVIVKKVYLSDINPSTTSQSITVSNLSPGNYTVYAYANITSTEWQKSGEHIADYDYAITEGTTNISAFIDKELVTLTSTDIPGYPSTAMLLTGKKDIIVGLSATNETIKLKRPVSRLRVYVRNHTTQTLTINDMHFSHINPDKAFVIEHTDSEGQPVLPAGTSYRMLPAFSTTLGDVTSVSGTQSGVAEKVLVYSRLLYENKSTNSYKLFANMTLGSSTMDLGERPFGPIDYYTLKSMDVDESVDVLLVNPQMAKRSGRIFCYISSDNYMAWESAGYASYSDYFGRAREIYYGSTDSEGTDVMGEDSAPTANGYTRWYGDATNIPDKNNTAGAAYQFCTVRKIKYEPEAAKQNKYFHALTKDSDGLFTFSGLAYNNNNNDTHVTGSSIAKLRIEEGTVNDRIPQDIRGKLVRFIATNSTGSGFNNRYMQANVYFNQNEARQVESNLKFVSGGNNTSQDRQFILFGKYVSGGQLKRLESGTNKEITLTYMSRNEDIEVVIDVYYADQTGILSFEVNNTNWTTPVTSTHIFN